MKSAGQVGGPGGPRRPGAAGGPPPAPSKPRAEENWDDSKAKMRANWEKIVNTGVDARTWQGTTVMSTKLAHTHDGVSTQFESDSIGFSKDTIDNKKEQLESWGVRKENLYEVKDRNENPLFLLLYEKKPDGSIEMYRTPEEHPAYQREASAQNLTDLEEILEGGQGAAGNVAKMSGAERFAARAQDVQRGTKALDAINKLTIEQARYIISRDGDPYENDLYRIGSIRNPVSEMLEPIVLASAYEDPFIDTLLDAAASDVADQLALKEGLVRATIKEAKSSTSAGELNFDVESNGVMYNDVVLPIGALKHIGEDIYLPLEYLEQ